MASVIGRTSKGIMDVFRLGGKGGAATASMFTNYIQELDPYTVAKMTGLPQMGQAFARMLNPPLGTSSTPSGKGMLKAAPNFADMLLSPTQPTGGNVPAPIKPAAPAAAPAPAQPMAAALAPAASAAPEPGTLAAMPGSSGIQSNKPSKPAEEVPFTEGTAGPYAAPTGQEGAIAAEQKKQTNIDALIVALGEMGASLMGPFQESWQAQLGRTASGLARQRVFAGAMEQALAGEIPEHTEILTPEQQIQISQAAIQKQAAGLEKEKVGIERGRAGTEAAAIAQTGEYQKGVLSMSQKELDEKIRQFDIEAPIQKAESAARVEQYKAYAKAALDRVGVSADKAEDVYQKALDFVNAMGEAYKTKSPEDQGIFFTQVMDSIIRKDFSGLGAPAAPRKKSSDYLNRIKQD